MRHKFCGGAAVVLRPLAAQSGSNRSLNRTSSAAVSSVTSWPIFMSVSRQAANKLNLLEKTVAFQINQQVGVRHKHPVLKDARVAVAR